MDLFTIVVVVAYLAATAYLGWMGYKQTKSATDYLVAGRKAHPVVMALSYGATFISTSAIVGFGGVAANFGMGLLWLTFFNIFVGIFVAFVFFGGRTRRIGHHLNAHTFPELMGKRFNSRFLHLFSALVIFTFMPLYAMAVMRGGAEFIAATFQVSPRVALYLFALIVAAYVIPGGIKGVMLTDALQGGIMLAGMIFLIVWTYASLGGVVEAHQALTAMEGQVPPSLTAIGHQGWTSMPKFGFASGAAPAAEAHQYDLWWIMVTTIVMGVGIGVLAQPQLIVRFMTVQSQQALNRAVVVGGVFIIFMTGVAFTVGPLSNVFFAKKETISCHVIDEAVLMDPGADGAAKLAPVPADAPEEVKKRAKAFVAYRLPGEAADAAPRYVLKTPAMKITRGENGAPDTLQPGLIAIARSIDNLTTMKGNVDKIIPLYVGAALPKWFGVVFMLTLLAAAMSTLSSQFHTMGTAIGRDVFEQVTGRTGNSVLVSRLGTGLGLILAIILGAWVGDNIIALATAVFFGLCAAAFLPAFLAGLFWRRVSRAAVIASVLAGFLSDGFWILFVNAKTAAGVGVCQALFGKPTLVPAGWSVTWSVVDPLVIGIPCAAIVLVVVGLLARPMDPAYAEYCFGGPKPPEK
jgi:solute:Na+ symporter, SSS family